MLKEIKNVQPEADKRAVYKMMHNQTAKMMDLVGTIFTPEMYVHYVDTDEEGKDSEILIMQVDGALFGTVSKTFITSFCDIVNYFGFENIGEITVKSDTSKNDREFIICELA